MTRATKQWPVKTSCFVWLTRGGVSGSQGCPVLLQTYNTVYPAGLNIHVSGRKMEIDFCVNVNVKHGS